MNRYIRIAVSVLLLALIAWRTDWGNVVEKFAQLRIQMWLAAAGLYMFAQLVSARRWQLFARELRFERSLAQYCAYYFIGMYFNLLLPTSFGGDVMRVWYLNGNSGRKWEAFTSVLIERVNGLLVLIALACLGVVIYPLELPLWIPASVWGIAGCAILGMASLPILRQKLPLARRQQLQMFLDLMRSPRILLESTFLSILTQVSGVLLVWFLGLGLGLDVPLAYYCVLVPMVSLLMLLPLSVNGMGVREYATVLFLQALEVEQATALTLAFLWFTVGVAVSLTGGVVYLFGAFPKVEAASSVTNQVSC